MLLTNKLKLKVYLQCLLPIYRSDPINCHFVNTVCACVYIYIFWKNLINLKYKVHPVIFFFHGGRFPFTYLSDWILQKHKLIKQEKRVQVLHGLFILMSYIPKNCSVTSSNDSGSSCLQLWLAFLLSYNTTSDTLSNLKRKGRIIQEC